jgi:hypothetical protein
MALKDSILNLFSVEKVISINNVTAFILLLLLAACGTAEKESSIVSKPNDSVLVEPTNKDSIAPPIVTIAAADLSKEYLANEIKADDDYNRKQITVTGTIADIKKSLNGEAYVILAGAEKFTPVQCYLENTDAALALKKGDALKIRV